MYTTKYCSAVILGFILIFSSFSAFSKWPIKKFIVVEKINENTTDLGPLSVPADFIDSLTNLQNYLSEEQELVIENWLEQVAYYYDSQGFLAPHYEAIGGDEEEYYEVHVFPFSSGGSARTVDDCDDPEKVTVIQFNPKSEVNYKNGKLTTAGYQTLAHELFHTVQASYPYKCKHSRWVLEGTAEAIGIETARTLLRKKPYTFCQVGYRPYSSRLYSNDKKKRAPSPCGVLYYDYQANSFWQYLGEYSVNKRPTPEKFVPPNYRFLHDFFNTKNNSPAWQDEYDWLERALQKKFGFSLSRAYPSFVGTFAGYWKRLPSFPDTTSSGSALRDKWYSSIFGGCDSVIIPNINKPLPITLSSVSIDPVASRCIELVTENYTGLLNLTIKAEGTGIHLLNLAVSSADGEKREQPIVYPNLHQPEYVVFNFSVPVQRGVPKYFIVSNVANTPQYTSKQTPSFNIAINTASASIRDPKTKSPAESEQGALEQSDSGKILAKAQIKQGVETESWTVQAQRIDRAPCENAFKNRVCGPVTSINIGLADDAGGIMREAVQPSMSFERLANVMGAIDELGGEKVTKDMIKAQQNIGSEDGAGVGIVIPLIEYGFTGSFNNALISVYKAPEALGNSAGTYKSIGPGWIGDCDPDGYHPYSGKVTIEEASHQVLRGTYSANLVDEQDITNCESAPVAKHISGTFSLPNPRIGKDEPEGVLSEDLVDHTIQQINELMPGMYTGELGEKAREVAKQKLKEKEARKAAKQKETKSASVELVCECSCETASTMLDNNPDCFRQCLPIYQNCENFDQIASQSEYNRPPTNQEAEQIAKLREEFEVLLENKFPTQEMQNMMLKGFDDLPNLRTKQELVGQFKTKPQ